MTKESHKIRSAVKRDQAESYLLISLVAFAVTVIGIRVFLEATGYPQIGNSVLHIAHAIWGGLLLFIAVILPLLLAKDSVVGIFWTHFADSEPHDFPHAGLLRPDGTPKQALEHIVKHRNWT